MKRDFMVRPYYTYIRYTMVNKSFKTVFIVIFLLSLFPSLSSQTHKRFSYGFYGGWAWGTGDTFQWHYRPYSDRYSLQYHLGGYVQLNFTKRTGLQLDVNYQNLVNEWTLQHPSLSNNSGKDGYGFTSVSLKSVFNFPQWGLIQPAIAAGGGVNFGEWNSYEGIYYHVIASPGIKVFFWKSHPHFALTLGCSFTYLYDPGEWSTNKDFYIRVNLGLEF
jgi:hypothetical protein